jgi:hypothetical protein
VDLDQLFMFQRVRRIREHILQMAATSEALTLRRKAAQTLSLGQAINEAWEDYMRKEEVR